MLLHKLDKYLKLFFIFLIEQYQKYISIFLLNRCRFYPTCSEYAKECLTVFPIYKAIFKIIFRILRCNPCFKGGIDEVK